MNLAVKIPSFNEVMSFSSLDISIGFPIAVILIALFFGYTVSTMVFSGYLGTRREHGWWVALNFAIGFALAYLALATTGLWFAGDVVGVVSFFLLREWRLRNKGYSEPPAEH